MAETLLLKRVEDEGESATKTFTWGAFFEEVKETSFLAVPFAAVVLCQYMLQIVSVMIVGHIDTLALSSTAIAISLCGVTGFSILMGMASALETLGGQAFGAEQYQKLGTLTYTAMFCLLVTSLPLAVLWAFTGKILVSIGQDPLISQEAGKFMIWLIPGLFAYAILHPLLRYYQMQVMIWPGVIISLITFFLHIPICWALVYKTDLRNLGGAVAMSISNWLNVILLGLYMKFAPECARTRAPISMEIFHGIGEFFRFAIPSAAMICLEWWSFELIILLSGLLPNPRLETSVISVCFDTLTTVFTISYGIGGAGSTRIAIELGAGRPQAARLATAVVTFLAIVETIVVTAALFALRDVFGYAFSSDDEVVSYVSAMTPLACLSVLMDSIQGVLQGVARGCGWQHIGAYINLGAFYLCGIPAAAVLGFLVNMKAPGLWIGVQIGTFVQTLLLGIVTSRVNWEKQAIEARERATEGGVLAF